MITEARIATTDNITLSGDQTLQGVDLVPGTDVVLVCGQTDGTENGPRVVQTGAWSRHPDHDTDAEFVRPWRIFIREGTYANWTFQFTNLSTPTLGTSVLNFEPVERDAALMAGGGIGIDESADTVGLPSQPSADTDLYVGPLALSHSEQGVATLASANEQRRVYIEGLIPTWQSGTFPTGGYPSFSPGAAWIDVLQRVIENPNDDNAVIDALPAASMVSFFLTELGDVAGPIGTTPGAPYKGTARAEAVGLYSRYVCSLRTNAAGNAFYRFFAELMSEKRLLISYLEDTASSPFRVVTNSAAQTEQTVGLGLVAGTDGTAKKLVPPTSRMAILRVITNASAGVGLGNSEDSVTGGSGNTGVRSVSTLGDVVHWVPLDSNQSFTYWNRAASGSVNIDVLGFVDRR